MSDKNLRIVWDNAADRGTIATSSEAGQLGAINLRSNLKSRVWRGLELEAAVVCQWTDPEPIGCVVLAFNNFTPRATMRVRGYRYATDLIPEFDSGDVLCAPPPGLGQFAWGTPMGENFYQRGGASLFAYGYGGYGTVWVPGGRAFRKMDIRINDVNNPDGYLEAGRLICGPWWTPLHNFNFGHNVTFVDSTQNKRTEAGDLRGERAAKWRRIECDLQYMDAQDRAMMMRLFRSHGVSDPIFISLFPENDDSLLEQSYQLWGKFADSAPLSQPQYDAYATKLVVEEM